MARTVHCNISFGVTAAGLSDVRVQPLTSAMVATGPALSATIVEMGLGMFGFSGDVPDDAVHWKAYSAGQPAYYVDSGVFQSVAGESVGATPAQLWAYAQRTLTSFPPSFQLTTPQPGVGLFIPGARLEQSPARYRGTVLVGSSIVLLQRVVGFDGDWIQQADVSAVESVVLNLQDSTDADTATHTVGDVVYDELQADGRWTEDGTGYNVAIAISGNRITAPNTTYLVTATLTTADGPIVTQWEVQT